MTGEGLTGEGGGYNDSQPSGLGTWVGGRAVTAILENTFMTKKSYSGQGTNLSLPPDHLGKKRWSPVGKGVGDGD